MSLQQKPMTRDRELLTTYPNKLLPVAKQQQNHVTNRSTCKRVGVGDRPLQRIEHSFRGQSTRRRVIRFSTTGALINLVFLSIELTSASRLGCGMRAEPHAGAGSRRKSVTTEADARSTPAC